MALLQDGDVSSIDDLKAYEADIQETASAEGLDIDAKVRLAQFEIAAELEASGQRPGSFHTAGNGTDGTSALRFDISQVVVTPALKMWHTFQALSLFYRDAKSRRTRDSAGEKWLEYRELSKWSSGLVFQTGIGIVLRPVPRPSGINVALAPSTSPGTSYRVRTTWLIGDEEGAPTEARAVKTTDGQTLLVDMPTAPGGVTGWNVYVSEAKGELLRQNLTPIAPEDGWTLPEDGLRQGERIGDGQLPDVYRTVPHFIWRG